MGCRAVLLSVLLFAALSALPGWLLIRAAAALGKNVDGSYAG